MKSKPGNVFLFLTDEVKHAVLLQRKLFEESQPAPSCTKIRPAKKILQTKAQEDSSALPVEGITVWKLEVANMGEKRGRVQ